MFFPFFNPQLAYDIHAKFPQYIGIFARLTPVASLLLLYNFSFTKSKIAFFIMILVIFTPLTRLSRIDIFISILSCYVLNSRISAIRFKGIKTLIFISILVFFVYALVEVGTQRLNRYGKYDVHYSDVVEWHGLSYQADLLSILYAYFPLSFENFDRFVRQYQYDANQSIASMEWLFIGIFKFNKIFNDFKEVNYGSIYTPVSTGATVPTLLAAFYRDFGAYLSFIPIVIVFIVAFYLRLKSQKDHYYLIIYSLYMGGFALASFQPVLVHPILFMPIVGILFLKFCHKCLLKRRIRKGLDGCGEKLVLRRFVWN
jgi:hypothetical protein